MKKTALMFLTVALTSAVAPSAFAGHHDHDSGWSTAGKVLTGVFAGMAIGQVLAPAAPAYVYEPAPTYVYAPPPVVYAPAPVVYAPAPAVYAAPPVVYAPAPVVYAAPRVVYAPRVVCAPPVIMPRPVVSVGFYGGHYGGHSYHRGPYRHGGYR